MLLLVVLAVIAGIAVVATGRWGGLPDVEPERSPRGELPADSEVDRPAVDGLRFSLALRGYRMDEVDDVLDRLGAELAYRDSRIAELEAAAAVRGAVEAGPDAEPGAEPLPGLEDFAKVVEPPAEQEAQERPADQGGAAEVPVDRPVNDR